MTAKNKKTPPLARTPYPVVVIVTTYNRPDALALSLESLRAMTVLPHQVIVADDGSGPATRQAVEALAADYPTALRHVWHPDQGFRLARIRNAAIAAAPEGAYIVQLDGDIVVHRRFLQDHLALARKGWMVRGGRVRLSRGLTRRCCLSGRVPRPWLLSPGIMRERERALRLPWGLGPAISRSYQVDRPQGTGCNMAYWRDDALAVNGYDEAFVGYGCEDSDMAVRLLRAGIHNCKARHCATAFHLWHPEADLTHFQEAQRRLALAGSRDDPRAARGLSDHLPYSGS